MGHLVKELQDRVKESLKTELDIYLSQGLIDKDEHQLIGDSFVSSIESTTSTLPSKVIEKTIETSTNKTGIIEILAEALMKLGLKVSYDDSPWDGDASNWKTAESYCSDCLIDMNKKGEPKSKENCKLPFRKEGSGAINKNALRAMASGGRGVTALKGVPRNLVAKAANFMITHWPRAFDKSAPANIYRLAGKNPPESKETSVEFLKDKSGQWWMLGIYSNRWMDREHEILSEDAHKEYSQWVNETGFKPQLVMFHLPRMPEGFWNKVWDKWGDNVSRLNDVVKRVYEKTSVGEVERVVYMNGFSVAVSKIYPEKYGDIEKLAEYPDIGMSHGFLAINESDPDFSSEQNTVNIIDKYRTFEVSLLPRKKAANYGTASIFVGGKSMTFSEEDRKFLSTVLPEDLIDSLDEETEQASEALNAILEHKNLSESEDEGTESKEADEEASEDEDESSEINDKENDEADAEVETEDESSEEVLVKAILKVINVEGLQEVLTSIQEQLTKQSSEIAELKSMKEEVETLKQSEDERIADAYSPINWGLVGHSASKDKGSEVPEDVSKNLAEKIDKIAPKGGKSDRNSIGDPNLENFYQTLLRGVNGG